MTLEQIKTEMTSLMEKVSKLESTTGEIKLTKEQLTDLVKLVIEDTTREIRDGMTQNMLQIDDYIHLGLNDREIYVDADDSQLLSDITEIIDENGFSVIYQSGLNKYTDELMTRIKK